MDSETAETFMPAPLDKSKVRVGDTVTVSIAARNGTPEFQITGPVYGDGARDVAVGDYMLMHDRVTLLAHTPAPEPVLPTTDGSRVRQSRPDRPALPLVEAVRVGGSWVRVDEFPERRDRLDPSVWRTGWELVHDAGAEPRPLPTREQVAEAIMSTDKSTGNYGLYPDVATKAADAVLALLGGEVR